MTTLSRVYRFAAASLLIGGFLCVASYVATFVETPGLFRTPQLVPGLVFGAASIVVGALLWRNHPAAPMFAVAAFALQTFSLTIVPHVRFLALAGPELQVVIAATGLSIRIGFGGAFIAIPDPADGTLGALGVIVDIGIGTTARLIVASTRTFGFNIAAFALLAAVYEERRTARARANGLAV